MNYLDREHESAERSMYAIERRIAELTQYGRPSPDSINGRILVACEAKREREAPTLMRLRKRAARVAITRAAARTSGDFPIATAKSINLAEWPDLPAFLRRNRMVPA